jgi:hypothetical protein
MKKHVVRWWVLAAVAVAACAATWTAVVRADEGLARMTGTYSDQIAHRACHQFILAPAPHFGVGYERMQSICYGIE